MNKDTVLQPLFFLAMILAIAYFFPWRNIDWGQISFKPSNTVTVTGSAESKERNEIASFSAGVSAVNDDKQTAIDEVNTQIQQIIDRVKEFGISADNIKTQNISIYQMEDYNEGRTTLGQWRASNSIEITLKDVEKTTELSELLFSTGANNVYGPNFRLDDTKDTQRDLLSNAIEDARQKAEAIAKSSEKTLGEVISVSESGSSSVFPRYAMMEGMGGGGAPAEPGTSTVGTSVTVVFELK